MQQKLAAARDEVPATVSVTTLLLYGRPARTLAALADSGGYDLVVAGPRPVGRLRRLFGRERHAQPAHALPHVGAGGALTGGRRPRGPPPPIHVKPRAACLSRAPT